MAMNNTTTKKTGNRIAADPAMKSERPKDVNYGNRPGKNDGQMRGNGQADKFADPLQEVSAIIGGLSGTHNDIGELSGFVTSGYLDKAGTPYGESAKFNFLPPGMDISNQENIEVHEMPLRKLTSESYPGDGWMPAPRDIPE